ncbi:MAG: 23S rRNA (pseudouridine(1915)-N(3))-methyltransferase RlmH [bacterium]|jgi:23S rRNA (pseudouridine1915-N3)-methyltransferase|nr:23S rRNA (pseudouridine(1915)-N(3))-methyltransferase RlmH [bacterium]
MRLRLLAVGTRMPGWVDEGFGEYAKRLSGDISLELVEISAGKRTKGADLARLKEQEGEALLAAIKPQERVIALDVLGRTLSTGDMADTLKNWQVDGRPAALLVGGPEGLSRAVLERADEKWSLSRLTLPHPLVRIVIAEQVYRAWSLLKGHPYHR